MKTIKHYLNGKSFNGNSKITGKVFNPATGEQTAEVRFGEEAAISNGLTSLKRRDCWTLLREGALKDNT